MDGHRTGWNCQFVTLHELKKWMLVRETVERAKSGAAVG